MGFWYWNKKKNSYLWNQGVVESAGRDVALHSPVKESKRQYDKQPTETNINLQFFPELCPELSPTPAAVLQLSTSALSSSCT